MLFFLRDLCEMLETVGTVLAFVVLAVLGAAFFLIIFIPVICLTIIVSPILLAVVLLIGPRRIREAIRDAGQTEKTGDGDGAA